GWYSFHRQWGGSCLIVWCGNLTILLSGLTFHCFWYRKQKTLCDSLHRPSRSDFVQFEFVGDVGWRKGPKTSGYNGMKIVFRKKWSGNPVPFHNLVKLKNRKSG